MSLLAGAFLAGLAVLAVPLWLHRLNEQAPPERSVSSLMLMREAEEPRRTRRSLAHRVLLAMRLALLAALTLAFAQPVFESAAADAAQTAEPKRLIALDASLSMRRAWPAALAQAASLQRPGDRLATVGDRLVLIDDLGAAAPGWSRLDFAGLLGRLEAGLAALPVPVGGWEVQLVSDFQASAAPERFNALIEGASWPAVLHRVGGNDDNWALAGGELAGGRIEASLASFAGTERRLPLVLRRDGVEVQRSGVVVGAGSATRVAFDVPPAERAAVAWEVRLETADAQPEDDVLRIVQAPVGEDVVAVVAPNADPDAIRFLDAALEANGIAERVRVAAAGDWPRRADAVIVLDPGAPSGALERRVERHLDGGGGALLIGGPRSMRSGAIWDQAATTDDGVGLRVLVADAGHDLAGEGWDEVTVSRWLAPLLGGAIGATVLAVASESGEAPPLLTERRVGKGRMVMLLTGLDRDWSSLVLRPAFVGFVGDVIDYLAAKMPLAAHSGEAMPVAAASVQIFDSAGERVLGLDQTAAGSRLVRVAMPGFYSVHTPGREALLAVNVDPRESDLRPVSAEELQRWQDAVRRTATPAPTVPDGAVEGPALTPIGRWLLALAALLLVAETITANVGRFRWRKLSTAS